MTGQTRLFARHTARLFSCYAAVPRALNTTAEPSSACAKSGGGGGGCEIRGAVDYHQPTSARSPCHNTHNVRAVGRCLYAGRVFNTLRHFRTNSNVEAWRRNDEAPFSFALTGVARTLSLRMQSRVDGCAHNYTYVHVCMHVCVCTFTITRYLCMYFIYIYTYT